MAAPAAAIRTKLYVRDLQIPHISYPTRYQRAKMIVSCFTIPVISSMLPAATAKHTYERLPRKLAQTSHYKNSKLTSQVEVSSKLIVLISLTYSTSNPSSNTRATATHCNSTTNKRRWSLLASKVRRSSKPYWAIRAATFQSATIPASHQE